MKGFLSEWFGSHAGREFGNLERWFTEKPEDLESHIALLLHANAIIIGGTHQMILGNAK